MFLLSDRDRANIEPRGDALNKVSTQEVGLEDTMHGCVFPESRSFLLKLQQYFLCTRQRVALNACSCFRLVTCSRHACQPPLHCISQCKVCLCQKPVYGLCRIQDAVEKTLTHLISPLIRQYTNNSQVFLLLRRKHTAYRSR